MPENTQDLYNFQVLLQQYAVIIYAHCPCVFSDPIYTWIPCRKLYSDTGGHYCVCVDVLVNVSWYLWWNHTDRISVDFLGVSVGVK